MVRAGTGLGQALAVVLTIAVGFFPSAAWGAPSPPVTVESSPFVLPGLAGVACSTPTNCVAVGADGTTGSPTQGEGMVVPIVNGVPGTPQAIPGSSNLSAVACYTSSACVAVGALAHGNPQTSDAVVVRIANGVGTAAHAVPGVQSLDGVFCPSPTTCQATGLSSPSASAYPTEVLVPLADGAPGAAQPAALGGDAVACATSNVCFAVGTASAGTGQWVGTVTPITNGTAGAAQNVTAPGGANLSAVACANATTCVAVGGAGGLPGEPLVSVITNGVPGPAQTAAEISGQSSYWAVACATATTCVAVGDGGGAGFWGAGMMTTITNGVAGPPQEYPGTIDGGFRAITCPTATFCLAVGDAPGPSGDHGEVLTVAPGFVYPLPSFTSPRDGQTNVDTTNAFTWSSSPQVQGYELIVGTTAGSADVIDSGPLPATETSYRVPALPVGKNLYATLEMNGDGYWASIPTISFTAAPRAPGFTFPLDGQIGVDPTKAFTWTSVPQAQAYYLLVGTTRYSGNVVNSGVLPPAETSYRTPVLAADTTLYATLFTKISGGWNHYVATGFTTGPARATLVVPYNGDTALISGPLFSWTTVDGADAYVLTVGTTPYGLTIANSGLLSPSTRTLEIFLPSFQTLYATLYTRLNGQWAYQETAFSSQ